MLLNSIGIKRSTFVLFLTMCVGSLSHADLNQVESEHYIVAFKDENALHAHEILLVAEEVWDDLATAYDLMKDYQKIHIYVSDPGDVANGMTIANKNWVTVYTSHMDLPIRSSSRWTRNVVTHELAHVFSIKAANKDKFFGNFTIATNSSYQNPDWTAAFQYRDLLAPKWWVEGIAQYEASKNGNDAWDNYRDMLLRMAVLESDLLNYVQMGTFDNKNSFYAEMTYNQGFALMLYIESQYGEEAVRKMARAKSYFNFNGTIRKALGIGGNRLYRKWVAHMQSRYREMVQPIKADLQEGKELFDGGFWDDRASWSSDGKYVAFVSNEHYDIAYNHLFVLHKPSGKVTQLLKGRKSVDSRLQWFPSGKKIVYSRWNENAPYLDIFCFDLHRKKESQLTWQARAKDPAVSPDGKTIAYIQNKGGIQNLALMDTDGKNTRFLTNFNDATQLYAPCWTPDGKYIVVGIQGKHDRDLAMVSARAEPFDRMKRLTDSTFFKDSVNFQNDLEFKLLPINTKADERDPCISRDGRYLYFSSDRRGVFNIYRMCFGTNTVEQITNVLGGAFNPSVHPNGNRLAYTGYHAANFNLYEVEIEKPKAVEVKDTVVRDYTRRYVDPLIFSKKPNAAQYSISSYSPKFTMWGIYPYISFEPAFVTDTVGFSELRAGLFLVSGELAGYANMAANVYAGNDFSKGAGISWGAHFALDRGFPQVFGENRNYYPLIQLIASRDLVKSEDLLIPEKITGIREPVLSCYLGSDADRDTLLGVYSDDLEGAFRLRQTFDSYGLVSMLQIADHSQIGLGFMRHTSTLDGDIHNSRFTYRTRAFQLEQGATLTRNATDITDLDATGLFSKFDSSFSDTSVLYSSANLYDNLSLYRLNEVGIHYSYANIRPAFLMPIRADHFLISGAMVQSRFVQEAVSVGTVREDTLSGQGDSTHYLISYTDTEGRNIPQVYSIDQKQDLFRFQAYALERVPLPFSRKHSFTVRGFFGSLNRKLSDSPNVHSLRYRIAHYLKGYPYTFDPLDLVISQDTLPFYAYDPNDPYNLVPTDTLIHQYHRDQEVRDILWGNRLAYIGIEYSHELMRGITFSPLGLLLKAVYLTPFAGAASVWNTDWKQFNYEQLLGKKSGKANSGWGDTYLKDVGLRVDLPFVLFENWNGIFAFIWARRLDLDGLIAEIDENGRLLGLDKDRFAFTVQMVNW